MTRSEALNALRLSDSATQAEIKEAHRRLCKDVHPDVSGQDTSDEFRAVQTAYEFLMEQPEQESVPVPEPVHELGNRQGFVYLMLDNRSGLAREHGSPVNYRFELAEPQTGTPYLDWKVYDGTPISFVIEGDRAVDVTGESK